MRILVADDESTSRVVLAGILQDCGHDILECGDGQSVLDAMDSSDAPQLIVLDWMMPCMDGLDVLRRLRDSRDDQMPYVIMVTDKSETESIVTALKAGANDYICKPFDFGELQARVGVGARMLEVQGMLTAKLGELQDALNHIKTLHGLLHVCVNCKRIQDEKGVWKQMEVYVRDRTEADFSHGFCPQCIKKLYPDIYPQVDHQLMETGNDGE